ncbi:hypothetical protein C8F04DRAFT_1188890 [Mycena alexandri]|uniref:Uncharacterized protein n=1 Tax=Mycena alexandri TaxID=1745969 RepID=A0AAD6WUX0_9AGAR|nr:hypothetical protein C8F04DRAFT_1188890 [Mycena alexandri]
MANGPGKPSPTASTWLRPWGAARKPSRAPKPPPNMPTQTPPAPPPAPARVQNTARGLAPWPCASPTFAFPNSSVAANEGPDSDTESLDDSDSDSDHDEPAAAAPLPAPTPPPRPAAFIRVAPAGHPPGTRLPNGLMPGSVIRVATAAEVKARRLVKKHAKDRGIRFLDREQQRVNAGTRLKAVTRLRVRQTAPALHLDLSIHDYAAPVAASGWQAVRQDEPNAHDCDLDEIRRTRPDMRVYDWDATPTPIIDAERNILLLLGGFPPNDAAWGADVAANAAEEMEAAAEEIYAGPKWRRKAGLDDPIPRRGSHRAKHTGVAMGGGQQYPQNLAHAARNLVVFARLFGLQSLRRIAGWTNMLFMAFAPNLHEYYRATYAALCDWDRLQRRTKHIRRNFPERYSVFTTATYNFGPVTVTLPHIDFGNLAWGWCAVTALGNFDPDRGGHLDINADKSTTQAEREQRKHDRARRWQEGIRMYCKWDGPVQLGHIANFLRYSEHTTARALRTNKLELQRKARERMAKRRAKLKKSEEAWCAYTAKAREHAARYRASHAAELALGQVAYRARHSIARVGFNAWHDAYLKRHPRGPPPEDEELGDWPESSDSEHSASPDKRAASPISDECARPPTPPPESAPYDDHLNYFLDYLDPTMAPDYVPKPGQRPFFQRGNNVGIDIFCRSYLLYSGSFVRNHLKYIFWGSQKKQQIFDYQVLRPDAQATLTRIKKESRWQLKSQGTGKGKRSRCRRGEEGAGEHLDVIEGELGLIRGEDGAVHVVAGGAGGGHAVRVVASEVWVGLRPRSLEGFPVNVAVRPRVLGFGWVLCECERAAAGYGSLSVNRGGVLADKRGRCLHFGAVKAIESRDDEGERVLGAEF